MRPLGGWLAIADLIRLVGLLGSDEPAVRRATARMKRSGLLAAETRGRVAGYRLTDEAHAILREGDERIFKARTAADLSEGWILAVFSVPEQQRDQRHQLRRELTWLGFGQVAPGVWMSPRRMLVDAKRILERRDLARYVDMFEGAYAGFDATAALVARTWDLTELDVLYQAFVEQHEPVLARWKDEPAPDEQQAFVDYTLALSHWRRLPYLDPGLPAQLLPANWAGQRARELFAELVDCLQYRAFAFVVSTVRTTPALP